MFSHSGASLRNLNMWRVEADVHFMDDGSMKRQRYNPYKEENESDLSAKYRYSKVIFEELFGILGPSLERTHHGESQSNLLNF